MFQSIADIDLVYSIGDLLKRGGCVEYMIETGQATDEHTAQTLCQSALGPNGEPAPGMSADTW